MSSKNVVNVGVSQPSKKHWVRHALVVILLTLVILVAWLAYTSVIHKAA